MSDNPLLKEFDLKNGAPPLAAVKPEHYKPAFEQAIASARQDIDAIKENRNPPTFENTIAAMRYSMIGEKRCIGDQMARVTGVFFNILLANGGPEMRAMSAELEGMAVAFTDEVLMDKKLFDRVKALYDARDTLNLDPDQLMLTTEIYKTFVRSGALLSDTPAAGETHSDKEKLAGLNQKLSGLYTQFSNNLVNATGEYQKVITDANDLKGVPQRLIDGYAAAAEKAGLKGQWLIRLSPPPTDLLAYADNRALREEILTAQSNIAVGGAYDNRPVIIEIAKARHEKAQLLGFDDFASFMLDEKMAKTPKAVMDFLDDNESVYKPACDDFMQKVRVFAAKDGVADLQEYDMSYYSRKLKEETFKMEAEAARPYLTLDNVLDGLKKHAESMFGVTFDEKKKGEYPVFHEDIRVFEVKDKKSGETLGLFYGDYYARPGLKKNGAWMEIFRNRGLDENGQDQPAIVINCCNFQKPVGDAPTLLSMSEATTVFHEFGHACHALLGKGRYQLLTGYRVKGDFVELPSQLQENWVWEQKVLDGFAKHFQTGETIPSEMIKKLADMENFDAGYRGVRMTFRSKLDMAWHMTDPKDISTVEALEDKVGKSLMPFDRAGAMSTSFHHLFMSDEYAAGYYGYKWSEVLDADVFSAFKNDLYNKELAEKLRNTIYAKGGQVEPMELYKEMMGREPDPKALYRREGLLPDEKTPANGNAPKPPAKKLG